MRILPTIGLASALLMCLSGCAPRPPVTADALQKASARLVEEDDSGARDMLMRGGVRSVPYLLAVYNPNDKPDRVAQFIETIGRPAVPVLIPWAAKKGAWGMSLLGIFLSKMPDSAWHYALDALPRADSKSKIALLGSFTEMQSLHRFKEQDQRLIVATYIPLLSDSNEMVREFVKATLPLFGQYAMDPLEQAYVTQGPVGRLTVVRSFGGFQENVFDSEQSDLVTRACHDIMAALHDPSVAVRRKAAELLGTYRIHEDVQTLTNACSDPDCGVRLNAVNSLRQREEPMAIPTLRKMRTNDCPPLQAAVAEAIVHLKSP
jgi:hypothetical protein